MGANLKEVRERITSVNSTQQITKAMKMVSAAKLKKSQDAITQMRPYAQKLQDILSNIMVSSGGDASSSFGEEREVKRMALVVITSSRGLCGAFNNNVLKAAQAHIDENCADLAANNHIDILCIGKKSYDYFRKLMESSYIYNEYVDVIETINYDRIAELGKYLMKTFKSKNYDRIDVAYGSFKNAGVQIPMVEQFLPVVAPVVEGTGRNSDFIFEPNKKDLLEQLVPQILGAQLQRYILDTSASEHGARMTAMDKATENANDLIKELKITYNKARQEAITREISEIVGGAAALGG